MGRLYEIRCACGYGATVAGGYSVGEMTARQTVVCKTCRTLRDVPVKQVVHDPDARIDLTKETLRCSRRRRDHVVEPWTHPGPCPRCGLVMELGEHEILWD